MLPSRRGVLKTFAVSPLLLSPSFLSACAGGSTSEAGTLNVGQISDSVAFFPLFIGEERGFFDDEGLLLGDRPRLGTGAKLAAALKSGSIDLGAGVMTDALSLYDVDGSARVTTSLVGQYYVDVIVGSGVDQASGSVEDKVASLQGTKIGITGPGSGTEALVAYLFGLAGLDPASDAELVNLGAEASAALGALKSGRVDALSFFQPLGQQVEAAGAGQIYISPAAGDVPDLDGALHGTVFSREQILSEKSEEVASFQAAIQRSLDVIHGDESEVRELLGKYLDGTPEAAVDSLVPILRGETATDADVAEEGYEVARQFHEDTGLVKGAPSYDEIVTEDYRA